MDDTLGPFRIVARIARGGMGETFVAQRSGDAGLGQRVCLKRLLVDGGHDAAWVGMFRQEAQLIAQLHHPNIVTLVDFGQDRERWWMALELVEGTDLRNVLNVVRSRGQFLPMHAVLFIASELTKALIHAHARRAADGTPLGIVHRDVSPGNVMITNDGGVLLTDFGIAKVQHGERTRTGYIKGKAGYMAPEQSLNEDIDARTDLFALGVVMFELIAGMRPFDGPTWLATQTNAVQGLRHRLRNMRPETPFELERIVDRLLHPRPAGRFQNADELLDALSEFAVPANVVRPLGSYAREMGVRGEDGLTEIQQPPTRPGC